MVRGCDICVSWSNVPNRLSALRIEYLKSRARVCRFGEEVNLVHEEKRRTVVSLEKEAFTWDRREQSVSSLLPTPIHAQGAAAYAASRAAFFRGLRAKFQDQWNMSAAVHASADHADQREDDEDERDGTSLDLDDDDDVHFSWAADGDDDDEAEEQDEDMDDSDIE